MTNGQNDNSDRLDRIEIALERFKSLVFWDENQSKFDIAIASISNYLS